MHFSLDTLRRVLYPPAGDPKTSRTGVRRMKIGITQTFPQWVKIIYNPPFNLSNWGTEQLKDDVRWQYGMPPASNANFAWLQHMIYRLAPGGRMGMVLANSSLSSQSGGEGDIRKNIVNADLVDCIIAMPTQLFYTTQIPVSLWFISKRKKQAGKTLFIDARKMGIVFVGIVKNLKMLL